jgi:hypothetical protein
MKHLIRILTVILAGVAVCSAQESKAGRSCADPLTIEEVQIVGERIPRLQPGMSREEVFNELGADLLKKVCFVFGGGARWETYQLRRGYKLLLVFDPKGGGKLKSAEKAGAGWRRERRDNHQ